jgi:hypothetical protein
MPRAGGALLTAAVLCAAPALAQHSLGGMGGGHVSSGGHMSTGHAMSLGAHQHFDGRYAHNQYYYNHGYRTYSVPHGGYAVSYNGSHYYCYGGHWWGWYGGTWVVVGAPYGAFVPYLPAYYTAVWWGGMPYYYANDTYYVWSDSDHQYQVVAPPSGVDQANPPSGAAVASGELFVYPRNGQTAEQTANDRYECHRWAADQSGFDPSQTGGGVSAADAPAKRADYLRAQAACLDGRGYTVR